MKTPHSARPIVWWVIRPAQKHVCQIMRKSIHIKPVTIMLQSKWENPRDSVKSCKYQILTRATIIHCCYPSDCLSKYTEVENVY